MASYVSTNFPANDKMFVLSSDLQQQGFTVIEQRNPTLDVSNYHGLEGPVNTMNFWEYLPGDRDAQAMPDSVFTDLYRYFMVYHTQLCRDVESRARIAWFLVYWCLTKRTETALQRMKAGGGLDADVAVLMHALRIIAGVITISGVAQNSLSFNPFISGFIDEPENRETWINEADPESQGKFYLKLPSNPDDVLATTLRAHPNTFIVRLSPTHPMHLECIRYVVEDTEPDTSGSREERRARRKLRDYVVFYRLNMLADRAFNEQCNGGLIYTVYYMANMFSQQHMPGQPLQIFYRPYFIPLFMLLTWMMKAKATLANNPFFFAPLITDANAAYQNAVSDVCNSAEISESRNFTDYSVWPQTLDDKKEGMSWLLSVFSQNAMAGSEAALVQQFLELSELYRNYLTAGTYCQTLFPAMDNYGDPGCQISPTWMRENIPIENLDGNPLIKRMLEQVNNDIYSGSLWECDESLGSDINRLRQSWARYLGDVRNVFGGIRSARESDIANQKFSDAASVRYQNLWQLIRWLGISYFKAWSPNPQQQQNWTKTVEHMLSWMLRSGSVYPFFSSEQADNMIDALGALGNKHAVVVRLSQSQVLGIEIRTHQPNPRYNSVTPLESKYINVTIPVNVWAGVNAQGFGGRGVWFTKTPSDWREVDFVMRYQLYTKYNEAVMVRNLPTIKLNLESCNFNVDFQSYFWHVGRVFPSGWRGFSEIRHTFLRPTTLDALNDLDVIVGRNYRNKMSTWQKIKSLTVRVNAPGEGVILGALKSVCRPGTYPRMNFAKNADINNPICEELPNWIYDQPLLDPNRLSSLIKHYVKNKKNPQLLEDIFKVWQALSLDRTWSTHWCNTGNRGNRNKTLTINWLGADCVSYMARAMGRNANLPFDKTLSVKSPKDRMCFLRLYMLDLLNDPSFNFFANPAEAELWAANYPGFMVVSFSGTQPGALSVRGYSNDDITTLIHDEMELDALVPYLPNAPADLMALKPGLLIRLLIWDTYGMHVATIDDPKLDDATACGDRAVPRFLSLRDALLQYVETINFTQPVSNEYASRITAMLLKGAANSNPSRADDWYTILEKRQIQVAPWLSVKLRAQRGLSRFFTAFGSKLVSMAKAPYNIGRYLTVDSQWWKNPTNYWYATNTVEGPVFTGIVKDLLIGLQPDGAQTLTIGGYVKDELDDLAQLKPTQEPTMMRRIESGGAMGQGLKLQAEEFQLAEFRGEADPNRGSAGGSLLERFKRGLGFGKDKTQTRVGRDDARIVSAIEIADTTGDTSQVALVKSMLLQKKKDKEPFGPKEREEAIKLGIEAAAPEAPTPEEQLSAGAETGVPPAAGQFRAAPAGPMTDGPPFEMIKDPRWKDYNTQHIPHGQYFEDLAYGDEHGQPFAEDCRDNAPNYIFPAFDIDAGGNVVARCGREGWMMDGTNYPRDILDKLDPDNQNLLMAIRNMAKHWCPTLRHQIKLWRWLGVGCLGKLALDFLANEALAREEDTTLAAKNPIATLKKESYRDQLKMIQDFREQEDDRQRPGSKSKNKCKKRIIFLSQMISSNILFPYVRDRKNARVLAGYNPDKVVVMLGWSKSGSVMAMMHASSRPGRPLERTYMAEDLVNVQQYTPTTVRLKIFSDFYGGIAASNYLFYEKVLRQAKKDDCVQSLGAMKRYAVRAALPRSWQLQLDRIYQDVVRAQGQVTEEQRRQLTEIQNISILLQSKNLQANQLFIFEEILKLENARNLTPAQAAEQASRLYKARDTDTRITEAEQFENLALCQRPEFVPYIRKKIKEKYPEMSVETIERMDRDTLCRTLLNVPQLEQIDLPVYVWQITDVPTEFRNSRTQLLALWDSSREEDMNMWLMKNYGVSVRQMQEWNKDYRNESQLAARGRALVEKASNQKRKEREYQEALMNFREFLINGNRCTPFQTQGGDAVCEKLTFATTNGESEELCGQGCSDRERKIPALTLISMVFKNLCDPRVPLLMNDFEFIIEGYKTLMNYFLLLKLPRPQAERRLDKQCKLIQSMYTQLMSDAGGGGTTWSDVPLGEILNQPGIKQTVETYFNGTLFNVNPKPLPQIWEAFETANPDKPMITSFAFTVILYIAVVNGILVMPGMEVNAAEYAQLID